MLKPVKCNLCGSDEYSVVYKTYAGDIATIDIDSYAITENRQNLPLRIVKCSKCGLIYAHPRPSATALRASYARMVDPLYLAEEQGRRLSTHSILNELQRFKKSGRLLDIGCSTGLLLDEAHKREWEVYGVELSGWAVDYARNKLGLANIFQGTLEEAAYPSNYFDAAVLQDAIEHLEDPKGTLIEIRRILKPDGLICINTPDIGSLVSKILRARWWGVKQAHFYYFTRMSLHTMLDAAGFVPIKTKSHVRVFSLQYWVNKVKDYNKTLYRIGIFLMNRGILKKERLIKINLGDQIEAYARKMRKLEFLEEQEILASPVQPRKMRVVAVLPAYNAEGTLKRTVADIPRDAVDDIILVDDASSDGTVRLARSLGLKVYIHKKNQGYGANQKTCYTKALKDGADIIVMVHPDYQYDPKAIPQLIEPIRAGRADAVFGSRMIKGGALEGGMPPWKHNTNILLTALENVIFGTYLTEYHSGFRAYSTRLLESINFQLNSNGFLFDTEIIAQLLLHNYKIEEIPIRTRYFDEASTIKLWPAILYGLGILKTLLKYILHTRTFIKFRQFERNYKKCP